MAEKEMVIKIASDTSELKKGIKESNAQIKDFSDKTQRAFKGLSEQVTLFAKAWASFTALKNLTFDFAENVNKLALNAGLLGAKAGDIEALGNALKRYGGSTEDAVSAMKSLQSAQAQAKLGGGALVETAKRWGVFVSPYAKAEDALLSLGKQLSRFNTQQRVTIARQLGFNDSLISAFEDGGEELALMIKRQKELGVTTEKDIKLSKAFNFAWLDLQDVFGAIRRDIARLLLPITTKLFKAFGDFIGFLKKHKALVIGFFVLLSAVLTPVLIKMLAIAAPFIALGAIIAGIVLIFDDLYSYFTGVDSVTGRLVEKFPWLATLLEPLKPLVLGIMEIFERIVEFLEAPSWEGLISIIAKIGEVIAGSISKPFEFIQDILNWLAKKFPSLAGALQPLADIVGMIADGWKMIADLVGSLSFEGVKNAFSSVGDMIGGWFGGEPAPVTPMIPAQNSTIYNGGNTTNNSVAVTQNITASNPNQYAQGVQAGLDIKSINAQRQIVGAR